MAPGLPDDTARRSAAALILMPAAVLTVLAGFPFWEAALCAGALLAGREWALMAAPETARAFAAIPAVAAAPAMARKKARGARGAGGKPGRQERAARLPDWVFRPGPGPQGCRPPWGLLLAALALAWAARVAVALVGDFILHPDEIFQYYEPAHGVVFGNAIYTWEMATGARSFLIPGFIAGLLYALDFLGYGEPVHYVPAVKVVLCTISLALPVSMYFIARSLWSERAGVVAFLFCCFWYEFVGFAHKPLSDMLSGYAAMAGIAFACARGRTRRPWP